jgi:hypothetical protein
MTSSALSMGVVVPEPAFKLGGVEPRSLQPLADSGRTSIRWVCPDCGSWIAGPARDGLVRVRAAHSTIRRGCDRPGISGFGARQPWVVFGEGDETFETAPQARDGASSDLLNLQRSRRERLKQFSLIACLLQPCRPVRTILDHHLAIVDRRNVLAG